MLMNIVLISLILINLCKNKTPTILTV